MVARLALLVLSGLFLGSCIGVDSKAFEEEHQDYLNTLSKTQDQQLLLNIVKMKYCDNPSFMEIVAVTSQHSMGGSLQGSYSVTGSNDGLGNFIQKASETLTGAGSVDYRMTPTVSYQPLSGQNFVSRLLRPLDADLFVLLYDSGYNVRKLLQLCLEEMGGSPNAKRASGPTPLLTPDYKSFLELSKFLESYQDEGRLDIFYEQQGKMLKHVLVINSELEKFSDTLKIKPKEQYELVFNLRAKPDDGKLYLRSRSFKEILYYVSHNLDVPAAHRKDGLIRETKNDDGSTFDWNILLGDLMQVKSSSSKPDNAYIMTKYRDFWFYIDDTDINSKETFTILNNIYQYLAGNYKGFAPTLTIQAGP